MCPSVGKSVRRAFTLRFTLDGLVLTLATLARADAAGNPRDSSHLRLNAMQNTRNDKYARLYTAKYTERQARASIRIR